MFRGRETEYGTPNLTYSLLVENVMSGNDKFKLTFSVLVENVVMVNLN